MNTLSAQEESMIVSLEQLIGWFEEMSYLLAGDITSLNELIGEGSRGLPVQNLVEGIRNRLLLVKSLLEAIDQMPEGRTQNVIENARLLVCDLEEMLGFLEVRLP